jgi:hypothetical protein
MNTHDIDRLIDKIESSAAMDIAGRSKYIHDLRAAIEADHKRRGEPVAWVAADTLTSPHPACVSSLAYMSQLDKDLGREYVPLYAAPVAAQTADELAECRSAVAEVLALLERSLAVIQHDIDEIGGCDHSVGICCCELIHLADDIRAAMQRDGGGDHE